MNKVVAVFSAVIIGVAAIDSSSESEEVGENIFRETNEQLQKNINEIFILLKLNRNFTGQEQNRLLLSMHAGLKRISNKNYDTYKLAMAEARDYDSALVDRFYKLDTILEKLFDDDKLVDKETKNDPKNTTTLKFSLSTRSVVTEKSMMFLKEYLKAKGMPIEDADNPYKKIENMFAKRLKEKIGFTSDFEEGNYSASSDVNKTRRLFEAMQVKLKKYPFVASIHVKNKFICTGSVLSRNMILTAASCLQDAEDTELLRSFQMSPKQFSIRIGSSFHDHGGVMVEADALYFHPEYDPQFLKNNLVLVKMQNHPEKRSKKVRRIEYHRNDPKLASGFSKVVLLGFGDETNQRSNTNELSKTHLDIYNKADCEEVYSSDFVAENNFCAGYINKGSGACIRDVGGAAVIGSTLVGVASFGPPVCGTPDAPTVFTDIKYYSDWIDSIISATSNDLHISKKPYLEPTTPMTLVYSKNFAFNIPLSTTKPQITTNIPTIQPAVGNFNIEPKPEHQSGGDNIENVILENLIKLKQAYDMYLKRKRKPAEGTVPFSAHFSDYKIVKKEKSKRLWDPNNPKPKIHHHSNVQHKNEENYKKSNEYTKAKIIDFPEEPEKNKNYQVDGLSPFKLKIESSPFIPMSTKSLLRTGDAVVNKIIQYFLNNIGQIEGGLSSVINQLQQKKSKGAFTTHVSNEMPNNFTFPESMPMKIANNPNAQPTRELSLPMANDLLKALSGYLPSITKTTPNEEVVVKQQLVNWDGYNSDSESSVESASFKNINKESKQNFINTQVTQPTTANPQNFKEYRKLPVPKQISHVFSDPIIKKVEDNFLKKNFKEDPRLKGGDKESNREYVLLLLKPSTHKKIDLKRRPYKKLAKHKARYTTPMLEDTFRFPKIRVEKQYQIMLRADEKLNRNLSDPLENSDINSFSANISSEFTDSETELANNAATDNMEAVSLNNNKQASNDTRDQELSESSDRNTTDIEANNKTLPSFNAEDQPNYIYSEENASNISIENNGTTTIALDSFKNEGKSKYVQSKETAPGINVEHSNATTFDFKNYTDYEYDEIDEYVADEEGKNNNDSRRQIIQYINV